MQENKRLIEGNHIIRAINKMIMERLTQETYDAVGYDDGVIYGLTAARALLKTAKSYDYTENGERACGKWIVGDDESDGCECSECGAKFSIASYFCSVCGADMRAEEE